MTRRAPLSPVIIALDYAELEPADALIEQLDPGRYGLKVGNEMFSRFGIEWVQQLITQGFSIFLDLKFHDTPNTVARACRAVTELGVWMFNVHTLGGMAMLNAAVQAVDAAADGERPLLLGVTILTSMDDASLAAVGITTTVTAQVQHLASLCSESGLDGVVCSAQEASMLRAQQGGAFCLVTPGIRLPDEVIVADDQKRLTSPAEALKSGVNYLVIGRPITQAKNPLDAIARIEENIEILHSER